MSKTSLHPCPSCAQHLRAGERVCPFCEAELPEGFGASPPSSVARGRPVSRAALLFAAAAVAAGCGGTTEPSSFGPVDGGHDGAAGDASDQDDYGGGVTLYGPAPTHYDGGAVIDASKDAPEEDAGGSAIMYGPAPVGDGGG